MLGPSSPIVWRILLFAGTYDSASPALRTLNLILLTAYRAPNINAFAERFVRSIKSECLSQTVFVGQHSLDHGIAEYVAHYHEKRSHQGIGNEIVSGAMPQRIGQIEVKERLGGLLNHYHRRAA